MTLHLTERQAEIVTARLQLAFLIGALVGALVCAGGVLFALWLRGTGA